MEDGKPKVKKEEKGLPFTKTMPDGSMIEVKPEE